jgi:hypothetical protein
MHVGSICRAAYHFVYPAKPVNNFNGIPYCGGLRDFTQEKKFLK